MSLRELSVVLDQLSAEIMQQCKAAVVSLCSCGITAQWTRATRHACKSGDEMSLLASPSIHMPGHSVMRDCKKEEERMSDNTENIGHLAVIKY